MFNVEEFQAQRKANFGRTLHYFEELGSTNESAEQLAREGVSDGTVVLANSQTHGKGRSGHSWFSPPDVNLYFSLIIRPPSDTLKYLPFLSALSVIRVLKALEVEPDLKWPNDILVSGKKICGVLIQTASENNQLQFAIVGCGLNVNTAAFPPDLQQLATSICSELGGPVSRESLLASVLLEFEMLYEKIEMFSWDEFCRELEEHSSYIRGCEVRIEQSGQQFQGRTAGLDPYGGLILETSAGRQVFYAGEVQACRKR